MSTSSVPVISASVASFSIPFLISATRLHDECDEEAAALRDSLCLCCSDSFDLQKKSPTLLRCGHSICMNCLTQARLKFLELKCNVCQVSSSMGDSLVCNQWLIDEMKRKTS